MIPRSAYYPLLVIIDNILEMITTGSDGIIIIVF